MRRLNDIWPSDRIGDPVDQSNEKRPVSLDIAYLASYPDTLILDTRVQAAIAQFASDNGLEYSAEPHRTQLGPASQPGPAWMNGHDWMVATNVGYGTLLGYQVVISNNYTCNGSSTNGKLESWKKGVIRVKLPKRFPQIVLDSLRNDGRLMSSTTIAFNSDQIIALEGDFNEYFLFYAPKSARIDALKVLAPNFMQALIESSTVFDVELFDDELVLSSREPIYTEHVMQNAYRALEIQLAYMNILLGSWHYQPNGPQIDTLQKSVFLGVVLKIGKRRIPLGLALLVALGVLTLYIWLTPLFSLRIG